MQLSEQAGGSPEKLNDPDWVAQTFDGMTLPDLRESLRNEMAQVYRDESERQKPVLCAAELAKRLCQNIPEKIVAEYRVRLEQQFSDQLAQEGATLSLFLAQTGMLRREFDAMIDRQAHELAEQEAALHAYANAKKIVVGTSELPRLLNINPDQLKEVVSQAKAQGDYDLLIEGALLNKTVQTVIAEANCSYHFETEEEAQARLSRMSPVGGDASSVSPAAHAAPAHDEEAPLTSGLDSDEDAALAEAAAKAVEAQVDEGDDGEGDDEPRPRPRHAK